MNFDKESKSGGGGELGAGVGVGAGTLKPKKYARLSNEVKY